MVYYEIASFQDLATEVRDVAWITTDATIVIVKNQAWFK